MKENAKFIVFEGIDGSGKSSVIRAIKEKLQLLYPKIKTTITSELKGTKLGIVLSKIIFNKTIDPLTRSYLFAAMRSQNIHQIIKPNLKKGNLVIADRFLDSSLVYQGLFERVGIENVKKINKCAIDCIKPDFVFILNTSVEESINNIQKRKSTDQFDQLNIKHKKQIINYYRQLAKNSKHYLVIDINKGFEYTVNLIWEKINQLLKTLKIDEHTKNKNFKMYVDDEI